MKFTWIIFLTTIFLIFAGCSEIGHFPELSGPYLGQSPPDGKAELFAPDILSTELYNRDMAMTPDGNEIYTTVQAGGYAYSKIIVFKNVNSHWRKPMIASFCGGPESNELEPALSHDGKKLFFLSNRPDSTSGKTGDDWDIWIAEREKDGWGAPYNPGTPVNTDQNEYFPSVTKDGTLYFNRRDAETREEFIYRSRLLNGQYGKPERLPDNVNCGKARYNAFIAPDESYIIVPAYGMEDSFGGTDYYIVYRSADDRWSRPINLGDQINTADGQEWTPYVSPDGMYFFFMSRHIKKLKSSAPLTYGSFFKYQRSAENGNPDIYWTSASFIEDLRPEGF